MISKVVRRKKKTYDKLLRYQQAMHTVQYIHIFVVNINFTYSAAT